MLNWTLRELAMLRLLQAQDLPGAALRSGVWADGSGAPLLHPLEIELLGAAPGATYTVCPAALWSCPAASLTPHVMCCQTASSPPPQPPSRQVRTCELGRQFLVFVN